MAMQEFIVTEEPFLQQVYCPKRPDTPNIDFVFVHGLNPSGRLNHAFQTWTHAEGKTPWPYQFLPEDFPKARIWIFGYNSNVTRGVSEANISDHANSLLDVLQRKRQQGNGEHSQIPIIFLGHSLGGLVIKQALLNAKESPRFNPTWRASFGLVFFGTPHRGGNTGGLAALAARLAKFFANDSADNNLLMCLKPNSLFTQESAERFSKQVDRYIILTFFETRPTKFHGFSKIVVNRESAILGVPHEVSMDLNRNHRDICKFGTRGNAYSIVQGNLRDIVSQALESVGQTPPPNDQPHDMNEDVDLGSRSTIALSSQETITSHNPESASQNNDSPAFVKTLNDRFSTAVKELDTLLIYKWIKDPFRRPKLNAEHIRSALLDLASMKKAKDPRFRLHAVRAILDECDADLECIDDVYKATPLILAASCGREAITKLLIGKGASLEAKDGKYERTALSWAARNNFVGIAEILLRALDESQDRQTIQSKDIDGHTAFALAYHRGYMGMVRLIESQGASLNV